MCEPTLLDLPGHLLTAIATLLDDTGDRQGSNGGCTAAECLSRERKRDLARRRLQGPGVTGLQGTARGGTP